jgi:hypothetical protein
MRSATILGFFSGSLATACLLSGARAAPSWQGDGVILVQEDKLNASDASEADRFGWSIDIDGERIVVGAPGTTPHGVASGTAYIFLRQGSHWNEEDLLIPSDGGPVHLFGTSTAIDGDRVLIGSPNADGLARASGAAYSWTRSGSDWTLEQKLFSPDGDTDQRFGMAVDLEGDRAVIGSNWDDPAGAYSGSAHVFALSGGSWSQEGEVVASDGHEGDEFGRAVALSGDRIAIGAPGADAGAENAGAVYVFVKVGGAWLEEARLTSVHAHFNAMLGSSVALEGDRLVAGAPQCGNCVTPGWASVFHRDVSGWHEEQLLIPPDGHDLDRYGNSVAIQGETILVGAPYHDYPVESAGAFYVWRPCDGIWQAEALGTSNDAFDFDEFAFSVALDADTIAVGVWRDDDYGSFSGSAYTFRWSVAPPIEPFCFGTPADCPCGNGDPSAGCANSSGQGALLAAISGSTSVAQDDLVLQAAQLPANTPCFLFYGGEANHTPFGDGLLCAAKRGTRLNRFPPLVSDASGVLVAGPGLVGYTQAHFPPARQLRSCESFFFQLWYEDPMGPCASGVNLSNALELRFVP